MNRNADDMLRTLRPSGLDTAVAESHARRREQDLANALNDARPGRAVPVTNPRRRMPRVLIAGLAAGAVAAAAAGVIVATDGSGRPGGVRPTASGTGRALDARTILLASAETVAKTPATTGAYWYVRVRDTGVVHPFTVDKASVRKAAGKGRVAKSPPLTASVSKTEESWDGRNRHDRTITGIDPKITFPSPAEEAKWKKMSTAERVRWGLDVPGKPRVNNYDFSKLKLSPTQRDESIEQLTKLPTDAAALEKVMRKWYKDENQEALDHDGVPTGDSFALSVFGNAQGLLAGPLTPGAKAALYRVLAKQPGIRYLGMAADPMGRKGAVLAMGSGGDARQAKADEEIRLIIDPKTGQLLAQESGDRKAPMRTLTYEAMGWVNTLGARP
jgi:hypothetical protein